MAGEEHRREMEQMKREITEDVLSRISIRLEDEALNLCDADIAALLANSASYADFASAIMFTISVLPSLCKSLYNLFAAFLIIFFNL